VAAGTVSFAGRVAGRGVVSVRLAHTDLRTTYEPVEPSVEEGEEVAPGEVVGTLQPATAHCGTTCLHWGLRRDETYLNPLSLLPPWLQHRGPSRLLPVLGVPLPGSAADLGVPLPGPAPLQTPAGVNRARR
jgi:murein DD-endopeptidase MepM/ murein hydrolase activator NlpD